MVSHAEIKQPYASSSRLMADPTDWLMDRDGHIHLRVRKGQITAMVMVGKQGSHADAETAREALAMAIEIQDAKRDQFVQLERDSKMLYCPLIDNALMRCWDCGKLWETECECLLPDPMIDPDGYAEHIERDRRKGAQAVASAPTEAPHAPTTPAAPPEPEFHAALRSELMSTLAGPISASSINVLLQQVKGARSMLLAKKPGARMPRESVTMFANPSGVIDAGEGIGSDYEGVEQGVVSPYYGGQGAETFGAQVIREAVSVAQRWVEAQNNPPPSPPSAVDMVVAISHARREGLTDLADQLESKLLGRTVVTTESTQKEEAPE